MASYPTRLRIDPERMDNKCAVSLKACFDSYAAALDQAESLMEMGRASTLGATSRRINAPTAATGMSITGASFTLARVLLRESLITPVTVHRGATATWQRSSGQVSRPRT